MPGTVQIVDESVKEEILRYPTVDLIKMLFPSIRMKGRSILPSPFRADQNASFSCFRDRHGISRWKDFGTGESGDNINLYRKVFPELDYVDAVNALSTLVLGRSAMTDFVPGRRAVLPRTVSYARRFPPEEAQALRVDRTAPILSAGVPRELLDYCDSRGISRETVMRYCEYVEFTNLNVKDRLVVDKTAGVPVIGADGEPVRRSGRSCAVGLRNDIGGYSLRAPAFGEQPDIKLCTSSFPTTILADGTFPRKSVGVNGDPNGIILFFYYDESRHYLQVGPNLGFTNVQPYAVRYIVPFLDGWMGRNLEGRDGRGIISVLNALNGPVNTVVTVVEGMFDALSHLELNRLYGNGALPSGDLVVLNSTGNLSWVYPFLSMHSEVRSLLDNDMKSSTGQKAFEKMRDDLGRFSYRTGTPVLVRSNSSVFKSYKDLNEYLVKSVCPSLRSNPVETRITPAYSSSSFQRKAVPYEIKH